MKKTLFLLAILASTTSFGQIRFGASAGIFIPAVKYDSRYTSPHSGGEFLLDFSASIKNRLLFTAGLGYASLKFSKDVEMTDNAGNKNGRISTYYNSADFLDIPLGITYEFTDKKVSPFASLSVKSLIKVKDGAYIDNAPDYATAVKANASSFILQPGVDLGVRFLIKEHAYLNAFASYNYQIQYMYKAADKELKYNSVGINISAGYRF